MTQLEREIELVRQQSMQALEQLLPQLPTVSREAGEAHAPRPEQIVHHWKHSNDLLEVRLSGRSLMVKRGVEEWATPRFQSSRVAAELLRESGIEAPGHLDVTERIDDWPILAWWRIPRHTLAELWPRLDGVQRERALRSFGALLRRIHRIELSGWGPLCDAVDGSTPAEAFLQEDLQGRLRPALLGEWPDAVEILDVLSRRLVALQLRDEPSVLVHNDPHFSNVLCTLEKGEVGCAGMLDLEASMGGAPEMDLAYLFVVHSPLMAGRPAPGWQDHVLEGYGGELRPALLSFFKIYHLLNLGFHAALTGWEGQADAVLEAARSELQSGDGRPRDGADESSYLDRVG